MIVEINGVKMEVDERTAKTIEAYKVGDRVKVLKKQYGDSYRMYPGVIVNFVPFKDLPSIEIMYLDTDNFSSKPLAFLTLNNKTEGIEIAPMSDHELVLDKEDVISRIDDEIRKRRNALEDMEQKKEWFISRFADAFPVEPLETS